MNLKSYLFTVCPRDVFNDLLKKELNALEMYISSEARRLYFNSKENSQLKAKLENVGMAIGNCEKNLSAENLIAISTNLETLYKDEHYKNEKTDVKLLENHFIYLSALYSEHNAAQKLTENLKIEMHRDLEIMMRKMPRFSAPRTSGFLSKKDYTKVQVDKTMPYFEIVDSLKDEREKYYYLHLLDYLYTQVKDNLKGYNLKFEKKPGSANNELSLSFYKIDPKTYETVKFKTTIDVDLMRKKMRVIGVECNEEKQQTADTMPISRQ
jgi:hypothetical protein